MCISKTSTRASVLEFIRLIDDVDELKAKLKLVQDKLGIVIYWSTDDDCWKIKEPKKLSY